ncbi:MAG: amidohydrolase family protein [Burkholderiales bacterium]|jgi:predicted TIM-barrel fold metal-dependent hydrolase|nr:amidohydrolase family protein [Burkholderiales bacterium]
MNYQGPVIDTHHHLWLREYISWLQDPAAPHMAGDLFGIRTDYPVEEWMRDVVPAGVVKSVHVTANWGVEKSLSETKWLQSISDLHGFPNAIVFQADMTDTNLESKIKEHLQYPNVRGVRHQIHWDDTAPYRKNVSCADLCNTQEFRRGFDLLAKEDLHFELQIFAPQAVHAVELVKAYPEVRFILLHSGMLFDRSASGIGQWREALALLASYPNVAVKISGLGMFSGGITYPQIRQVIRDCIQIFGVGRTIFGSNFPLEKLHMSYTDFITLYRKVLSEYAPQEQRQIFYENAQTFYRI